MNIRSSRRHAQVISRFTCGKIQTVILATIDLSICLPFCAENDFWQCVHSDQKSTQAQNKVPSLMHIKTDATINRLQTVWSKKTFRADYLQTVRLGESARCQREEKEYSVWKAAAELRLQVCRPPTPCVCECARLSVFEVQKSTADYHLSLSLPLSHLLQSPPLAN